MKYHHKFPRLFLVGAFILLASTPFYAQKPSAHPYIFSGKQRRANAHLLALWNTDIRFADEDDGPVVTLQTVQKVLNQRADVNARDKDGNTALMEAAPSGDVANVRMLLARGANPEAKDNAGRTALCWAITGHHRPILAGFVDEGVMVRTPQEAARIHKAYLAHQIAIIQLLIDHGADVNTQDHLGDTPLIIAADATTEDGFQEIPVLSDPHRMTTNANVRIVKILLAHRAEVNTADRAGETALMAATTAGKEALVTLLLAHGADVNREDSTGTSALMRAVVEGNTRVVTVLLAHGANVNAIDHYGESVLMMATRLNQAKVATLLKAAGAR